MNDKTPLSVDEIMRELVVDTQKRKRLTQRQMAERLGITQGSYSNKIRGQSAFTLNEAVLFCKHFYISLDKTFGLTFPVESNQYDDPLFDFRSGLEVFIDNYLQRQRERIYSPRVQAILKSIRKNSKA